MTEVDVTGKPRAGRQVVRCNCGGIRTSGTFQIEDQFLLLESDIGTARVLVGLQEPRRLATKLMRNICLKFVGRIDDEGTAGEGAGLPLDVAV